MTLNILFSRKCLELNIELINLRNLDQDMIENLFGRIRSACQVAKTPTVCNLQTGYTTTMITNLTSSQSLKANCEKDSGSSLIHDLTSRLSAVSKDPSPEPFVTPNILYNEFPESEFNFIEDEALLVLQSPTTAASVLINPSQAFVDKFKIIFRRLALVLPFFCFEDSIKQKLLSQIEDIEMGQIGCIEHIDVLIVKMKNFTALFVINMFCKRVNNILSGKISLSENPNAIEIAAFKFRNKKKGIGKYAQGNDY